MAVSTDKTTDAEPEQAFGMLTPPAEGFVPFDGKAKSMKLSGEVAHGQLVAEVYDRLGGRDDHEVTVTGEGDEQTLWVLGDVDMRSIRGVVDSHTPDPHFGLTEEQQAVKQLKERLASGEDLPASDLNRLLRAML